MTREELRDYVDEQRGLNNIPYHVYSTLIDGIDTLEQEPCEDWCDVLSDKMTLEQARQAVKDLRKKLAEYLWQEPCEDAVSREAVEKITWEEPSYTDALNVLTEVREKIRQLPSVTPKARWIPVNERLPKVADCYAVTRKIGSDLITSACFFDGMDTWHNDNRINHERNYLTNIVAWMPLPKPYKVESEDKE